MRRVYSEGGSLAELSVSPALEALAERDVQLLVAVHPGQEREAARLVEAARERELSIGIWPMLADEDGRWLNPDNRLAFRALVDAYLDAVGPIDTMVLDLEPPITQVREVVDGRLGAAREWLRRELDVSVHEQIVATLGARGVQSFAAVVPLTLLDGRAGLGWQRALGTPVDEVAYDVVSPMLYTSLFEGYGFGVVRRADARDLLRRWCALAVTRFGRAASVSLGTVGGGALGDERPYRTPRELADDVAIASAAGVQDLALFDLTGALARGPIDPWLRAFVDASKPPSPAPTTRAAAIDAAARITGVALAVGMEPQR